MIPVTIENDAVKMDVYPTFGGKVTSIIDKADRFELLFNYPAELPTRNLYDTRYAEGWYAGWDECFPGIARGPYLGHPYDGINCPDHGEIWGLPTTAVPTKNGITTVWHGLRFGYRLTRKLYLEDNVVIADYTLVNLSPFDFYFVWALHALMSMASPVELGTELAGQRARVSHNHEGIDMHDTFVWPNLEQNDFSRPAQLPQKLGWKIYPAQAINSAFVVKYPERKRTLTYAYSAEDDNLPAWWGLWINTGGWAGHHHFAVEPTTGRFDHLDRSIRDASAGKVAGNSKREWSVKWTLGAL